MHITKPKSFDSFLRQIEQFMVYASNSTLGATGFADIFIVGAHFVEKIQKTGKDGHIQIVDLRTYLSEKIRNLIYTVNWEKFPV